MKVIKNQILPFGNYYAINLFGIVFAKGECDQTILRHEYIHSLQMKETLFIGFYIIYLIEWLIRLIFMRSFYQAYRSISFEKEAYAYDSLIDYPLRRRKYVWLKFLRM